MFYMAIENEQERSMVKRLYEKYRYLMFSQANKILQDRHLAEDAVHQAFIRVIDNLHKIDELNCPRTRSFLVIICENIAKDMQKRRLPLNLTDNAVELLEDTSDCEDPMDVLISKESVLQVKRMIKELDPTYCDVLSLSISHKYSNEEIAVLLDISLEAAKKRLYRARMQLKERLSKEGLA